MYPNNQTNYGLQGNIPSSNINPTKSPQTLNPFQQGQFGNQAFLSPQAGSFGGTKNVYASTIHASTSSSNLSNPRSGFGKLDSMARTIKDDSDPIQPRPQQTPSSFLSNANNNFSFKNNNDKGKLASSVIFQKNYDQDINRFPGFNVNQTNNPQVGTSKLDALYSKKQNTEVPVEDNGNESAQDRRKR